MKTKDGTGSGIMLSMKQWWRIGVICGVSIASLATAIPAFADEFSGGSYKINGVIGNSTGDTVSGGSYQLTSTSGESVIGNGTGGSYKLGIGYVSQLEGVPTMRLDVQPSSLVAYYTMLEGSGSAVSDASVNNLVANTSGSPTWVAGKIGSALSFNGSSQYASSSDYDISGSMTVEAWVYPTSASATSSVVSKNTDTTDNQASLGLSAGNATFSVRVGGSPVTVTGAAVTQNVWTHLVGVYDGTNVRLYVNGSPATPSAASGVVTTNNLAWTIGKTAGAASGYFTGRIDEVKIFSRALSLAEVSAEYTAQNSGVTSGLALPTIVAGASQTTDFNTYVTTNLTGYDLTILQDHNLQSGANTIPAVGATIASPAAWSEGTTKGLGFTLTSAPNLAGKWGSGANYAALPGTATSFYTRSGATPNARETISLRLRSDVAGTQPSGNYQNTITVTGTAIP